jgi:hypothetical protein
LSGRVGSQESRSASAGWNSGGSTASGISGPGQSVLRLWATAWARAEATTWAHRVVSTSTQSAWIELTAAMSAASSHRRRVARAVRRRRGSWPAKPSGPQGPRWTLARDAHCGQPSHALEHTGAARGHSGMAPVGVAVALDIRDSSRRPIAMATTQKPAVSAETHGPTIASTTAVRSARDRVGNISMPRRVGPAVASRGTAATAVNHLGDPGALRRGWSATDRSAHPGGRALFHGRSTVAAGARAMQDCPASVQQSCRRSTDPERLSVSSRSRCVGVWRSGLLRQLHGLDRRQRRLR